MYQTLSYRLFSLSKTVNMRHTSFFYSVLHHERHQRLRRDLLFIHGFLLRKLFKQ